MLVLPLVRQDHVDAFEGGSPADTPNLDDLSGDSLRFDRTVPESMPGLSARRALITGMRAYPFRDWRRTDGLAPVPGFTPIWDHQPVLTETLREHGVETAYVSDNPTPTGPRWPDVKTTGTLRSLDRAARHRERAAAGDRAPDEGRRAHLSRRHPRAPGARGSPRSSWRSIRSIRSMRPWRRGCT